MREEHVIERHGKRYILYAGLLAEAHERFDKFTISTELLHLEPVPVVRAIATCFREGAIVVSTSGIGTGKRKSDKSGAAADAPVEMAETRAKARALRDATNIGETAFEEIGELDVGARGHAPNPPSKAPRRPAEAPPEPESGEIPEEATESVQSAYRATRQQIGKLEALMQVRAAQTESTLDEIRDSFVDYLGFPIKDLTRGEAEKYIATFQRKIDEHEAGEQESA